MTNAFNSPETLVLRVCSYYVLRLCIYVHYMYILLGKMSNGSAYRSRKIYRVKLTTETLYYVTAVIIGTLPEEHTRSYFIIVYVYVAETRT